MHGLQELYGGVGTIGLHLADRVSSLVCSDENPHNRLCFKRSAKALPEELRHFIRTRQGADGRESDLRMACSQLHEKLMQLKESELMQEKRCLEVQRRAQKDNSEMQTHRRRQRKMWKKLQQGVGRLAGAPEVAELQEQLAQWQETKSAVRPARSPYDEVSSLSVLEKDGFQRSRRMLRRLREAFGPEDVDEAAGISELTFYHKDNEKAVELLEKMKEVCEEEKTDGVVSKLQAKVSDPFVAQFLCGGLNFFTVKEMTYTELLQCQFAAHDVLGGLVECGEAAKTKNAALFALRFSLYAIKVSAIFLPLLPPLGLLIHKAADLALARLSKEVENQLDALEKKMDETWPKQSADLCQGLS
eukprot:g10521.t1